jgi:hypothetical protein
MSYFFIKRDDSHERPSDLTTPSMSFSLQPGKRLKNACAQFRAEGLKLTEQETLDLIKWTGPQWEETP